MSATVCGSCGRANRAGNRFCGGCGSTLVPRCPACGAQGEPDTQFCGACGASFTDRASPTTGGAAARKVVTIVFADLVGSTALHERLDAESVRRFMDRYYAAMRADRGSGARHTPGVVPAPRLEPTRPCGPGRRLGTRDGGRFEDVIARVWLTDRDRIERFEFFDAADADQALARFAELCAETTGTE